MKNRGTRWWPDNRFKVFIINNNLANSYLSIQNINEFYLVGETITGCINGKQTVGLVPNKDINNKF